MALPGEDRSGAVIPDSPATSARGMFLQRRSYRRRRLLDGLKMLPFLGAWLFLLPLVWTHGSDPEVGARSTSSALIYVFGVWFLLIVLAFGFLRGYRALGRVQGGADDPAEAEGPS